jgi:hypothetical protein
MYLQRTIYSEEKTYSFLREFFSPEDIFGNLVPLMKRLVRGIKVREPRPPRRVRKPQRKRGYDDKGSLLLPHEVHSDWSYSGPNPERIREEHRRPSHPYEWLPKGEESGGSKGSKPHPKTGGILSHEGTTNRVVDTSDRGEDGTLATSSFVPEKFDLRERLHEGYASFTWALIQGKISLKDCSYKLVYYLYWIQGKEWYHYGEVPPRINLFGKREMMKLRSLLRHEPEYLTPLFDELSEEESL